MTPDNELLGRYARTGSEEAFAELVRRYVNLVYSAALRQVGEDAHLAQDVAQTVFADLARKAGSLARRQSLSGWLYTSAHFAAAKIVRTENRRRDREEKFMREPIHDNPPEADWEKLRPALDAAMHELKESDREAVLLRYFQNESFAEVGAKLNLNENTARMRVERALEKLRGILGRRGIATSTTFASFATLISAKAVQTAPVGLAATLTSAAITAAGIKGLALFQFMTATKLKFGIGALATTGAVVALVMQHQAQTALRAETDSLTQQVAQLKNDNADLSSRLSSNSQPLANDQLAELLKLRAEVTRLRTMKDAPAVTTTAATNNLPPAKKIAINLKLKFVSLPSGNRGALGLLSPTGDTSILSEQQFALFNDTVRAGAELVMESQITTFSGREATIQARQPVYVRGTNGNLPIMLYVLPFFSSDSSLFTLNLAAQWKVMRADPAQPGVQTILASNQVNLVAGQTVALRTDIARGWPPNSTNVPDEENTLLVFVTPRIVEQTQENHGPANNASTDADTARQQALQKLNDSRQAMLAVLMFTKDNQNLYPTNLAQASQYMKNGAMDQIASNFDFLAPASITNITDYSRTIVLREKQAWQTPNGNWLKTYGFADGHAEIHSEPTDNFDDFEKDRLVLASPTQ